MKGNMLKMAKSVYFLEFKGVFEIENNLIDEFMQYRLENFDFQQGLKCDTFKLWLTKDLYYKIKVFNNKEVMYEEYNEDNFGAQHRPNPYFLDVNTGKYSRFETESGDSNNEVGELTFSKDNLGSSVVAHEVTHAILHFLRLYFDREIDVFNKIKEQDMRYEEMICYMIGDCTSAMYECLYEYKII